MYLNPYLIPPPLSRSRGICYGGGRPLQPLDESFLADDGTFKFATHNECGHHAW